MAVSIALGTLMVTLASGCASSGPHGPTGQARAATTAMASPSATAVALPAASPAPGAATPAPAGPREFPVGAGTSTSLQGVTCVGANDCWAVGWSTSETTGYPQAMIAEDTGIGWEVVSSPAPSGSVSSQLDGVACAGSGDCWAVGSYWQGAQAATGISLPLIEQDTGSGWKVVPGPSPAVGEASSLNGVTCLGAGGCWAVGYSSGAGSPGAASQTLIEQNTGSGWNIVSSPDPSSTGDGGQLAGVSCVSAAGCWAVGYWDAVNGVPRTLIEQYAGGGWSIVSSPGPSPSPNQSGGAGSILLGVTCAGGSGCWAVGYSNGSKGTTEGLVEEYGASGWSIVPSSTPAAQLLSVACAGAASCWAVGASTAVSGGTLVAESTGLGWSTVSTPNAYGTTAPQLNGVACESIGECWAVGGPSARTGSGQMVLDQLSGSTT
ncbi:MAG: hypothetical protein ACLQGJ_10675 [Candidatus Dormibacteria bacterium]